MSALIRRFPRPALVVLLVALYPLSARADGPLVTDVATARKLFAEAEHDEETKQWAAAADKFRRIVSFKETAGVRFHLALAEERLGQLVAARADYQRAFDLSRSLRDADGRDVNERSGSSLADLLKRTPVVTVVPAGDVSGATVLVDGKIDSAATERPFPHDPGELVVEATAAGRKPFRHVEALAEGARVTVRVSLPELGAEPPAPPGPTSSAGHGAAPAVVATPSRAPAYAFAGLAVAGLTTGVVFLVQNRRLAKENRDLCTRADVLCDARRDGVETRYQTLAIAGGAIGLVSAAASVYFFTRGPSQIAVSPSGATLTRSF